MNPITLLSKSNVHHVEKFIPIGSISAASYVPRGSYFIFFGNWSRSSVMCQVAKAKPILSGDVKTARSVDLRRDR